MIPWQILHITLSGYIQDRVVKSDNDEGLSEDEEKEKRIRRRLPFQKVESNGIAEVNPVTV